MQSNDQRLCGVVINLLMRDSKEKLARNNPQAVDSVKSPSFVIHKTNPERNRSQHLRKAKLETETDCGLDYLMPSIGLNDRERLQQTILNLKTDINSISNENIKLRSKVMILEKQADKLRQVVDNRSDVRPKQPRELQRLCNSLKDRLRERNAEYQFLETQHNNLKRSIKRTRINEMEIENENLLIELQKMAKLYLELAQYREKTSSEREEWKKAIESLKQRSHYAKMLEVELQRLQKAEHQVLNELDGVKKKLESADQKRIKETNELKRIIRSLSTAGDVSPAAALQPPKASSKPPPAQQKTERRKTEESKTDRPVQSKEIKAKQPELKTKPIQSKSISQRNNTNNLSKQSEAKAQYPQKSLEMVKNHTAQLDEYEDDGFQQEKQDKRLAEAEQDDEYGEDAYESEGQENYANRVSDIIEFMTYRLRTNRISRSKLVSMIQNCDSKNLEEFSRFIEKEPFGIKNPEDNETVMNAITEDLKSTREVPQRFLELVPEYTLCTVAEEEEMTMHIRTVVEEYAVEINDVLNEYEDNRHMVEKSVLTKLLGELELQPQEIDYVICKLSMRSMDLRHLNYKELAEIFLQSSEYDRDFEPEHESIKKQPADVDLSDGSYQQL